MALCQRLISRGVQVYAVCRPNSRRLNVLPTSNGLSVVMCDMERLSELSKLIPGKADAFFHLAWAGTTGAGRNDMPVQIKNIRCTIDAVQAAFSLGCKVFLGAGSQAEYGRVAEPLRAETPCFPENGYGMAKLCAGQMSRLECERLGMDHIWLRIVSVYGPGDNDVTMISTTIDKLLAGERPSLTAGEQLWDYLFSYDAAEAFALAADKGKNGAIYPLGSGIAKPLRSFIIMLRDAIDPELPLGFGEIPYADRQVLHLQGDISALQQDTGFSPKTDFETGIRKTIEWMRTKKNERDTS